MVWPVEAMLEELQDEFDEKYEEKNPVEHQPCWIVDDRLEQGKESRARRDNALEQTALDFEYELQSTQTSLKYSVQANSVSRLDQRNWCELGRRNRYKNLRPD